MAQAVTYIEIDLPVCSLTYGTAPCTATLAGENPTGTDKCYNSFATCQDRANFAVTTETIRFCIPYDKRDLSIEAQPFLSENIQYEAGMLDPGGSMGTRSSLKFLIEDHPHDDTGPGGDPYLSERAFDAFYQGTHNGKMRARHRFLRGAAVRYITGTADQALVDMETRHFVVDEFTTNADNSIAITARDILKLADGDRAVAPAVSKGSLVSGISDTAASATLTPSGIGDTDYPASGKLNIGGKEIVSFTRTGDVLNLTGGRGEDSTDPADHEAGSRCQVVLEYSAQDPANIIKDLLETYAGVDSSFIPIADWLDETEAFYRRVNTAVIAEPTSVKKLVNELIDQCGLAVWWDDIDNEIKLQVLREITTNARTFDDSVIKEDTLRVEEQPKKRITRVLTYYAQVNPLLGWSASNTSNYKGQDFDVNAEAEAEDGIAHLDIASRWIPLGGATAAKRLRDLKLGRYRRAPRRFYFKVPRTNGIPAPVPGEGVQLEGYQMQLATGARETVPAQVVQVKLNGADYDVIADEFLWDSLDAGDDENRHIIIGNDDTNLVLRDLHDALFNPDTVAGEEVELTINAGVVVRATSTSGYALDVGSTSDWPIEAATGDRNGTAVITNLDIDAEDLLAVGMFVSGDGISGFAKIDSIDSASQVTLDASLSGTSTGGALTFYTVIITVNINGVLAGKGGNGGRGEDGDNKRGGNGGSGGDALYLRYPINLNGIAAADIQGGGGGGAGGSADYVGWFGPQVNGGGGGGGGGYGSGGGHDGSGASNGQSGGLNNGGLGGASNQGYGNVGTGGAGGDRAQGGDIAVGISGVPQGSPGSAGDSVNGWSYVTEVSFDGTYYGSKVN